MLLHINKVSQTDLYKLTICLNTVLAFKIQRASGKLHKWDQMANKICEISEQKKMKARAKEESIEKKLVDAQKRQEEYLTFQKTQTMERLQKWENRKTIHNENFRTTEKKRLQVSNKLTKAQADGLAKNRNERNLQMKTAHQRQQEKLKLEKINLQNRHNYLAEKTFK